MYLLKVKVYLVIKTKNTCKTHSIQSHGKENSLQGDDQKSTYWHIHSAKPETKRSFSQILQTFITTQYLFGLVILKYHVVENFWGRKFSRLSLTDRFITVCVLLLWSIPRLHVVRSSNHHWAKIFSAFSTLKCLWRSQFPTLQD